MSPHAVDDALNAAADAFLGEIVHLLIENRLAVARLRLAVSPHVPGDERLSGLVLTVEERLQRLVAEELPELRDGLVAETIAGRDDAEPEERRVLALVGCARTVGEIVAAARGLGMPPLAVRGILAGLLKRGRLMLRSASSEPERVVAHPELGLRREPVPPSPAEQRRSPPPVRPKWMRPREIEPGPGGR